jgi:hypothetical protein
MNFSTVNLFLVLEMEDLPFCLILDFEIIPERLHDKKFI